MPRVVQWHEVFVLWKFETDPHRPKAVCSEPGHSSMDNGQLENHRKIHTKTMGKWWFNVILGDLPSGSVNIAIEHGR